MTRVLLAGAGEVGRKHLAALQTLNEVHLVGMVEPNEASARMAPLDGLRRFHHHEQALRATRPDLVVVATPPGPTLRIVDDATRAGCDVLVEKPVALQPQPLRDLATRLHGRRVFVAFQTHFAPGVADLLTRQPPVIAARVTLDCRRDRGYYTGWRAHTATAGGVLHQQAIHGLALALRLWPPDDAIQAVTATTRNHRRWKGPEDQVRARVLFTSGREFTVVARTDSPGSPRHRVELDLADGGTVTVDGRNLEGGTAAGGVLVSSSPTPTHAQLRTAMYRALLTAFRDGHHHPGLYPLPDLVFPLEVITRVYAAAGDRHHRSRLPAASAAH